MARCLLVNPPFYRLLGSHYNANQLGIASIAAFLNENGHDAWVYNADFIDEDEYSDLIGIFDGNKDYLNCFEDKNHQIWEETTQKIVDFQPDWVGWFCYTAAVPTIRALSEKLKEKLPEVKQVVGGPHSSMDTDLLNRLPSVDFAGVREGEQIMLDLVDGKDAKTIKGITSRTPNGLHYTGTADYLDRNSLPFVEREKFWGLTEKQKKTVDISYIIRTISCPFACTYCASPFAWGRKIQMRSNESILEEVKLVVQEYWSQKKEYDYSASSNTQNKASLKIKDNNKIYFVDDIFSLKKKEFIPLMQSFIDSGIKFNWKCENRADLLDHEICAKMKEAGCKLIKIGVETGSDRILKQIKKKETREDMLKAAKILQDTEMKAGIYLMTGFPNETDEDLEQTISLAKEMYDMGVVQYFSLSVLAPYYGTEIYYTLLDEGFGNLANDTAWQHFYHQSPDLMVNKHISKEKLKEFLDLSKLNPKEYV